MNNVGYTGKVLSGTGSTYQVQLDPEGSPPGAIVSVTQFQIDSSQTIPANTYCIVILVDGNYYMQVPVWLPA